MNKHKYIGIVLLMGFSLIGIIAVQIYWMNNAITIKEKQFDQKVNQALVRASQRIERNQNAYFMSNIFSSMPQVQLQQKILSKNQHTVNDSIVIEFSDFWNEKSGDVLILNDNNNMTVETIEKDGIQTIKYGYDTIITDGNSTQRIRSYSSISKPKGNNTTAEVHGAQKNKNPMEEQLNNVMEQMILEFSIKDVPMEDRLSYSIIAPTLAYEFKINDINLDFEYGIANFRGQFYDKLKSKGFNKKETDKAYKTSLFPNDILMQSDQIVLFFPEKRNYIYGSLVWPFTGSLAFIIIILITFYFTLRIIFNQKKVSEIKSDFINNMTHEFKTPIATISLAADSITNPNIIANPEKVGRFTEIIKEENRRMNRQVESVLKMALIDKKDFNVNIKETYVHTLIEQAIKNISIQVEQKGGKIEKNLQAKNDLVKVDETHFVNVIYNLLDNANKYSIDNPPEILVESYEIGSNYCIAISDKGIGMDKDTLDKIFEKFYRVPTGNIHTVKGFGLGLSYVKAIVMQFKGDISVKSNKGLGSTFEIKIPRSLRKN
ncbi:MAG: HAMP domain-containing histidine kinase [Salinivirgaceae bacterium]|nr:HAMP domain-containing histidine kinase [Salinivirgaceae bacterium]